jgi:hypothetical protein
VILPFDRERLRERNALDDAQDRAEARRRSPAERVESTLELSQLVRDLSHATGSDERVDREAELGEKARLYTAPLRILAAARR